MYAVQYAVNTTAAGKDSLTHNFLAYHVVCLSYFFSLEYKFNGAYTKKNLISGLNKAWLQAGGWKRSMPRNPQGQSKAGNQECGCHLEQWKPISGNKQTAYNEMLEHFGLHNHDHVIQCHFCVTLILL